MQTRAKKCRFWLGCCCWPSKQKLVSVVILVTDVRKFRILGPGGTESLKFFGGDKIWMQFSRPKKWEVFEPTFSHEKNSCSSVRGPRKAVCLCFDSQVWCQRFFFCGGFPVFFWGVTNLEEFGLFFPYKWLIVNRVVILTILPKCDDHPNNPPRKPQPTLGFDHCSNCDQIWPGIVRWWLISADGAMLQLNGMIFQIIIWATKKQTLVVYCIFGDYTTYPVV